MKIEKKTCSRRVSNRGPLDSVGNLDDNLDNSTMLPPPHISKCTIRTSDTKKLKIYFYKALIEYTRDSCWLPKHWLGATELGFVLLLSYLKK